MKRLIRAALLGITALLLSTQDTGAETKHDDGGNAMVANSINTDSTQCDTAAVTIAHSDTITWPRTLQIALDSLVHNSSFLQSSQLGLMIYDLTADSTIYAKGEKQVLRPASTMKLLTAITALDKLSSAYQFKTQTAYTGTISDSTRTLNGDIYIIGGMDPRLGRDDLCSFATAIKELGIDTISGNLYADKSMKDTDLLGEGWCWDDDNPILSPLVYKRKDEILNRFVTILESEGITVKGELLNKRCPHGATHIAERTHTIEQVLHRMMKDSDNLYAEAMFYQIGLTQGRPSTASKSKKVMESLLRKMKMTSAPHRFADGSGLSLYNYLTAEIEIAFLRYAYANSDIYTNLLPSLPIAGTDGTLEKRMRQTVAQGNVRAKTGTVTGISSLSGYCQSPNGHDLCFVIINQGVLRSAPAKTFQDKVCILLSGY